MHRLEAQRRLELGLHGPEKTLDLALAPGVVGLAVDQPDIEIRAHDARMLTAESRSIMGVEFIWHAPGLDSVAQRIQTKFHPFLAAKLRVAAQPRAVVEQGEEERPLRRTRRALE